MQRPRSCDLRERALGQLDAGRPVTEVAALFGVHRAPLARWRTDRAAGRLGPRPHPGRPPAIGPADHDRLIERVRSASHATLREHCAAWEAATGVAVSEATMCRALKRVRWTRKKSA